MNTIATNPRFTQFRHIAGSVLGITLLLPASYFMLTITARILLGAKDPYDYIAPSFLQSPFNLFEFHKAQVIIGTVLLAIVFNLPMPRGANRQGHWLNAAIVWQGLLLLLILFCYTIIQHLRY